MWLDNLCVIYLTEQITYSFRFQKDVLIQYLNNEEAVLYIGGVFCFVCLIFIYYFKKRTFASAIVCIECLKIQFKKTKLLNDPMLATTSTSFFIDFNIDFSFV